MERKRCPASVKIGDKTYHPYPGDPYVFEGKNAKVAVVGQCKSDREVTGRSCRAVKVEGGYCKMMAGRLWRDMP